MMATDTDFDEFITGLLKHLARKSYRESALLYPHPDTIISVEGVLDFIADKIGTERVSEIFNAEQELIEAEEKKP